MVLHGNLYVWQFYRLWQQNSGGRGFTAKEKAYLAVSLLFLPSWELAAASSPRGYHSEHFCKAEYKVHRAKVMQEKMITHLVTSEIPLFCSLLKVYNVCELVRNIWFVREKVVDGNSLVLTGAGAVTCSVYSTRQDGILIWLRSVIAVSK